MAAILVVIQANTIESHITHIPWISIAGTLIGEQNWNARQPVDDCNSSGSDMKNWTLFFGLIALYTVIAFGV